MTLLEIPVTIACLTPTVNQQLQFLKGSAQMLQGSRSSGTQSMRAQSFGSQVSGAASGSYVNHGAQGYPSAGHFSGGLQGNPQMQQQQMNMMMGPPGQQQMNPMMQHMQGHMQMQMQQM